jgi:hypothetical protein
MKDVGIVCVNFSLFYGHLVYFVGIWYIHCMVVWYIFSRFGMLHQEKSGSPDEGVFKFSQNFLSKTTVAC